VKIVKAAIVKTTQSRRGLIAGVAALDVALLAPSAVASSRPAAGGTEPRYRATSFDPIVEAKDYSNNLERQALYLAPDYQLQLRLVGQQNVLAATQMAINDPQREFVSDLCWNGYDGCAGDVRLYDWQTKGYGIVRPFLFTARNGAQLSGHVWATRRGPAKRPGVVITNGSVQATEQLYWFAAQALAKAGYVVMTFDPQGQGQSDTFGQGADRNEGFPAQTDGRPFYDGTEDALNFFFSNPSHPYVPVKSCDTGTSHADYQNARVKAGFDAAYNPFWSLLNRKQVGVVGHSYGAGGVSYVGQADKRVKAIVAWDNLGKPEADGREQGCVDKAARKPARLRVPALGMSADFGLPPTPHTSLPGYDDKTQESLIYSKHHVDTGEIVVRGGSHLDFSFIPNPAFGASLYGPDMIAWYTVAWFDYYLKHDRSAFKRLVTTRWQHDGQEAQIDAFGDPNMFSFYYHSRLDIRAPGGGRFDCETMRRGCDGMTGHDGFHGLWRYAEVDTTRDGRATHPVPKGTGIYLPTA
jgi:dienelactone hydrolase